MSIFKFKTNVPKSMTASIISEFDFDTPDTVKEDPSNILGLDIEQDYSDIAENEKTDDFLQSLNLPLPQKEIEDSQKLTNSRSLTMSKSRTKDELIPDNFTDQSIQRLETINYLLNQKDQVDNSAKKKIQMRLKKKISQLRIIKKNFSFTLSIGMQNLYDFQHKDISSLSNQLYLKHDNFVKRYILDVDYFRMQEICDNDVFQYNAISDLDENKIALSNNKKQILIYDVDKAKLKSMKLSSGIQNQYCSIIQLDEEINLIKNQSKNLLVLSTSQGLVNTYDNRSQKVTQKWMNFGGSDEQGLNNVQFIDVKGHENLYSYQNQWVLVDQRKPEEILQQKQIANLKKAMFMKQDNNIIYYQNESKEMHVHNIIQNKDIKKKQMQFNIVDSLCLNQTQELVVLQNNEIQPHKWVSQFNIIDNISMKLKDKDQCEFTLVDPITYIQVDKTQELIYGINSQFVRVWRYNNNDEMDVIKSNLMQVAN